VRAAEDFLMESGLARMSEDGFAQFVAVLEEPASSVPQLVESASRPAPWAHEQAPKR